LSFGQKGLGVEFKEADGKFFPAMVMADGLADGRNVVVLEFAHAGFAVEFDGEIPVGAMFKSAGAATGASGALAGKSIPHQGAPNDGGPGRELLDQRRESVGHVASGFAIVTTGTIIQKE
jgi:hypothetical protein